MQLASFGRNSLGAGATHTRSYPCVEGWLVLLTIHRKTNHKEARIWRELAFHLYAAIGHREWRFGLWWSRLQTGLSTNVIAPSMNPLQLALKQRYHKVGFKSLPATCIPPRTHASGREKRVRRPELHRTFEVALLSLA